MSPNTIRRGLADLKQPLEDSPYRVRQPGGGRKPVEKKDPAVIQAFETTKSAAKVELHDMAT